MEPTAIDPVGFDVVGDPTPAREALMAAMEPASTEALASGLAKLSMLTKHRQGEEKETRMLIAAYLERLSEIPEDMALYALKEAPNRSTWFPSWHDLRKIFDDELRERKMMLAALG